MRRLAKVILILSVTVLPLFIYLGWSLSSVYGWLLLVLLFGLILTFPFFRQSHFVLHLTFVSMGFLSFLIVFVLIKDALFLMGITIHPGWIYVAASATVLLGTFIAYRGPRLIRLRLPVKDLPAELEGFKIVQISDLHVGPTIRRAYVEKVVEQANELKADIIALTGDIGDGPVDKYRDDIAPFSSLKSRYGVFYVPGNHEYYWNANEWMNVMNNLKAIVLVNRGKMITANGKEVLVGGVPDPVGLHPDLLHVLKAGEDADYKILLSHRPGIAPAAAKLGFNLQLSGHTHGGQFFPWTIVVRFVHKHFSGHYKIDDMWLNVNTGTGSWGPFLRLGTTSEITSIELFSSGKSLE